MNSLILRVLENRECSNVARCHTIPHQGSYTVGKHSYDAVMLLLELWPEASRNLIVYLLRHDLEERWGGDIPAPTKWEHPDLAEVYKKVEQRIREQHKLVLPELTPAEIEQAAWVDRLELWLWCHDQLALGNRNAQSILNALNVFFGTIPRIPIVVQEFLEQFDWQRTKN